MSDYSDIDLFWSTRGDFAVDHRGDLMDTASNPLRSLVQEIRTRVEADIGDWPIYPSIGASLSDFIGKPNSPGLVSELKSRLVFAISKDSLVNKGDIAIQVTPISIRAVRVNIKINITGTPGISDHLEWLQFEYLYDVINYGIVYATNT